MRTSTTLLLGVSATAAVVTTSTFTSSNKTTNTGSTSTTTTTTSGTTAGTTTTSTTSLVAPAVQSNGLAASSFTWNGHKWTNNSGQTWNTAVPYAIGLGSSHVRFELHDTSYDHGKVDPSTKRRAEMGATASTDQFHNNTSYWHAFSFNEHWDCPSCMKGQEVTIMQMHWPSGASPAFAFRAVGLNGGAGFRITTRGDTESNTTRYTGPLSLDAVHNVVYHFVLNGSNGQLQVWLDGKQILDLNGVPVGSSVEDGYTFRLGTYGQLSGNRTTAEYGNIAPFPSSSSLSSRISAAPAW